MASVRHGISSAYDVSSNGSGTTLVEEDTVIFDTSGLFFYFRLFSRYAEQQLQQAILHITAIALQQCVAARRQKVD